MVETTTADVWEGFRSRLRGFIGARVGSPEDVEDILQDVFVKVHTGIGTVRDETRLTSWLYRVTRNAIVDHYRRRRPSDRLPDFLPDAVEPDDAAEELAPFMRELVEQLPDPYREALTLTELRGLTQHAMGERLGLSASGAKSRVQRGRAMLRSALLECCHVELDTRGHVIDYEVRGARDRAGGCSCAPGGAG